MLIICIFHTDNIENLEKNSKIKERKGVFIEGTLFFKYLSKETRTDRWLENSPSSCRLVFLLIFAEKLSCL